MLEIHAIRREDLLTAFSLSAVLRLRRRFQAFAELYRQQRGNTSCGAANRRNEKKALSAATSFFPFRLPLRGLKGASSPFLVGPARRNRWWFSGSLLPAKENISLNEKALYPTPPAREELHLQYTKRPSSFHEENLKVFFSYSNNPSGRQISFFGTLSHEKSLMRLSGVRGAGSSCRP